MQQSHILATNAMSSCSSTFVLANCSTENALECAAGQRDIGLENQRSSEVVEDVTSPIFSPAAIPAHASSGSPFLFSFSSGTAQPVCVFGALKPSGTIQPVGIFAPCNSVPAANFGSPTLPGNSVFAQALPFKDTSTFSIRSSSCLLDLEALPSKAHIVSINSCLSHPVGQPPLSSRDTADVIIRVLPELTALKQLSLRSYMSANDTIRICGAIAAAGLSQISPLVIYTCASCDEVASSEEWQRLPIPPPPKDAIANNIPTVWPKQRAGC